MSVEVRLPKPKYDAHSPIGDGRLDTNGEYGGEHRERLSFVRRARDLGFTLEAVRELWTLSDDKAQSCEAVDGIARVHLTEIDGKIGNLTALRTELDRVIGSCRHGTVADCKIIETLAPR